MFILWSRLGSRLPAHITREDGSRYGWGPGQYDLEPPTPAETGTLEYTICAIPPGGCDVVCRDSQVVNEPQNS